MKRSRGFTLIELMVVVAVIAILAAIALPSYSDYVTRSRITEAVSGLADARVRMEQYFQDNRCYNGSPLANCNTAAQACAFAMAPTRFFNYACLAGGNGQSYVWTASGIGSMTGFTYTVNQANARATTAVPAGWTARNDCWVTSKGGGC